MSSHVSAVPCSNPKYATSSDLPRPTANYHPSIWGDHFLTHFPDSNNADALVLQQHEELKEEIRSILHDVMQEPSKSLHLIDAILHLAVDYHFKDEIEIALNTLYDHKSHDAHDLKTIALRFRLLRQHGFYVSSSDFEKFKDDKGNFKKDLINDIEGMLSLYEAAHLATHGEDILDDAMIFTRTNLQSILSAQNLKLHLIEQIKHALNRPIRKSLQRLEARHYIDVYSNEDSHNATLLQFAKLDFNILQRQHQNELKEITKWWKNLDIKTRFPYVRDRIVELFFWIVGVYFEPHYALGRNILTKVIAIATILDDTYDNYATTEELEALTKAIRRWDIEEMKTLPNYMKTLYAILIDTYNDFEEVLAKEGMSFCVHYAKETIKEVAQAYLEEAKWRTKCCVPSMEEYLKVASTTTCYLMLATTSFLGMGSIATKEVFEWVINNPKIVHASTIICRLMDDIVSHKFEQKREHVVSGVECYVKQYGVEEEDVVELFRKEIANAWKDINESCLKPNPIPMPILERVLNLSRAMDVIYKDDDGFTNSYVVKHYVSSLLVESLDFTLQ